MHNVRKLKIKQTKQVNDLALAAGDLYSQVLVSFWRVVSKKGVWLKPSSMMRLKNSKELNEYSSNSVVQGFYDSLKSWQSLRKTDPTAKPPKKQRMFYRVQWEKSAICLKDGNLILFNGEGNLPLIISWEREKPVVVELYWNGNEYEIKAINPDAKLQTLESLDKDSLAESEEKNIKSQNKKKKTSATKEKNNYFFEVSKVFFMDLMIAFMCYMFFQIAVIKKETVKAKNESIELYKNTEKSIDILTDMVKTLESILRLTAQNSDEISVIKTKNVKDIHLLTVTAYSPRAQETDSTPTITASMKKVKEGTIAVSRDLFNAGWTFGKEVYITGYGVFTINDLMNKRFEKRIDVFYWNTKKALKFGKKELVVALMKY